MRKAAISQWRARTGWPAASSASPRRQHMLAMRFTRPARGSSNMGSTDGSPPAGFLAEPAATGAVSAAPLAPPLFAGVAAAPGAGKAAPEAACPRTGAFPARAAAAGAVPLPTRVAPVALAATPARVTAPLALVTPPIAPASPPGPPLGPTAADWRARPAAAPEETAGVRANREGLPATPAVPRRPAIRLLAAPDPARARPPCRPLSAAGASSKSSRLELMLPATLLPSQLAASSSEPSSPS